MASARVVGRWVVVVAALAIWAVVSPIPRSQATPVADEIHYSFTGPGSVTFDWRGSASDLRYGASADYDGVILGTTPAPLPFSSSGPYWEAHLDGLSEGATYHYSIGGGPDATFHTVPTGPFRFDVEADVGDSTSYPRVLPTQTQIAADAPSFVLLPGDISYGNAHGQPHVDQHFNDVMTWSAGAAYMPAWGNAEWDQAAADDLRNYKGRFEIPNAQSAAGSPPPGCCGEDWGWFDAGGVRFISYPEPYTSATWPDWRTKADAVMASAQADPAIHFVVTYGHRPAYSTGHHTGSSTLASILDGFGDTYSKYVVNFNAHSHDYERFVPIHGVTHITAAGGGASLELLSSSTDPRTAYRALHLEHVRVDVTATSMHIEAICGPPTTKDDITCAQGSVIDAVTIGSLPPPPEAPPAAAVSVGPSTGSPPLAVTADASGSTDTDATPIASYSFDFGDGSGAVGPQPEATATHAYQGTGVFMVTVTVTDSAGLSSTASSQVQVTDQPPPDAPPMSSQTVVPSSGTAPLAVTADASGSTDTDATPISSYTFDFGDGTPAIGPQPEATATHTYQTSGTYTVTVTVTDSAGLSSIATSQVQVSEQTPPQNLVRNPGFEIDTSGWKGGGTKVSLLRVAGGRSGSWAGMLTNSGTSTVTSTLKDSPNWVAKTSPGRYTVSAWVRSDTPGSVIRLRVREYRNGSNVGTNQASVPLATSWQLVTVNYTPAAPGVSTLDLDVYAKTPPHTSFLVDDVTEILS